MILHQTEGRSIVDTTMKCVNVSELWSAPRRSIEDPIRSVVRIPFLFSNIHVGSWDRCGARSARATREFAERSPAHAGREEAIVELEAGGWRRR